MELKKLEYDLTVCKLSDIKDMEILLNGMTAGVGFTFRGCWIFR